MNKLKPLGKSFIFVFLDDSASGRFIERHRGSVILTNQNLDAQAKTPRWGKVIEVGDDVKDIAVGDFVLIEALQWTIRLKVDDSFYWKSDESKVMAVTDSIENTYQ